MTQAKHTNCPPRTAVALNSEKLENCRYVRRELRDMTTADKNDFFQALRKFYTVSLDDGREMYGDTFANSRVIAVYYATQVRSTTHTAKPSGRSRPLILSPYPRLPNML